MLVPHQHSELVKTETCPLGSPHKSQNTGCLFPLIFPCQGRSWVPCAFSSSQQAEPAICGTVFLWCYSKPLSSFFFSVTTAHPKYANSISVPSQVRQTSPLAAPWKVGTLNTHPFFFSAQGRSWELSFSSWSCWALLAWGNCNCGWYEMTFLTVSMQLFLTSSFPEVVWLLNWFPGFLDSILLSRLWWNKVWAFLFATLLTSLPVCYFLLWSNNIPLYEYTTFCLANGKLMDIYL